MTDWEGDRSPVALPDPQPEFFFVPTYAAERAATLGGAEINRRLGSALKSFYTASKGFVTPRHAKGADAITKAWTQTIDAQVSPSEGLILSIS